MPEDRPIRWEYDLQERLFAPRKEPLPVPTAGVFDSPAFCLRINAEWAAHVIGALETLDVNDAWTGTADEIFNARQEVAKLMRAVVLGGCSEATEGESLVDVRIGPGGTLEKTYDGVTWLPLDNWVDIDGDTMTGDLNISKASARLTLTTPNASDPTLSFRATNGVGNAADIKLVEANSQDTLEFSSPGGNLLIQQRVNASLAAVWGMFSGTNSGEIRYSGTQMSLRNLNASGRIALLGSSGNGLDVDSSGRAAILSQGGQRAGLTVYTPASNPNLVLATVTGRTSNALEVHNPSTNIIASIDVAGAAAFTGSTKLTGQSSLQARDMAILRSVWETSTDASRKAQLVFEAYDAAGAREGLRIGTDGTNPKISFLGATPVTRPVVTGSRNGNPALASFLAGGAELGLFTDNTTPGTAPADGASAELRVSGGYIQWRQSDDNPTWANLVALADLQGAPGATGAQGPQGVPGEQGPAGAPGEDGQDCNCDGQPPAEQTTEDDFSNLCAGAFGLTDWLISVMQFAIDQTQLTLEIAEIVGEILDNFPGVFAGVAATLIDIVTTVIEIGQATTEAALADPAFREHVACKLYCLVKEQPSGENKFTESVFNQWLADLDIVSAARDPFTQLAFGAVRYAECSRRFLIYAQGTSAECGLCDCTPDEPADFVVTFIDLPATPVEEVGYDIPVGNARVTDQGNPQPSIRGSVVSSGGNSGHDTSAVIAMPTPLRAVIRVEVDYRWVSDGIGNPNYLLSESAELRDAATGTIEVSQDSQIEVGAPRNQWFTRSFTFQSLTPPTFLVVKQTIIADNGTSMGWIDNVKVYYRA